MGQLVLYEEESFRSASDWETVRSEKGEATLLAIFLLVALTGLITLMGIELENSFRKLQARTELFLCVKEINGELKKYVEFMGRINWAIKNSNRARLIMLIVPGLQGASLKAVKIKQALIRIQDTRQLTYQTKLAEIKLKGCSVDPRLIATPFKLEGKRLARDQEDAAILRSKEWTYYFTRPPYYLSIFYDASSVERVRPTFRHTSEEKEARRFSQSFCQ